ncbi:MAG: AgmX/PglI C-terminal domain-containing protein [Myxococcales bacterium]|nr:AgmX/PglI C-terminal domain-containing protein [Myxococcales bacterium]
MSVGWLRVFIAAALLCAAPGCKKDESEAPPSGGDVAEDDTANDEDGELEDPEESPYLDFSNFNDKVDEHLSEIVACYNETAGKEGDAPTGRVKTTFTIDGDGAVKELKFDDQRSTLQHPGLNKCIEERAKAWTFNISLTGADTQMPYTFELEAGGLLPE